MLVRSIFVVGILLVTLLWESPSSVHALGEERCARGRLLCTDENGRYTYSSRYGWTVTGVVWLDENQDGIRQPDEPVAPHEYFWPAHVSETYICFHSLYRERVNEHGYSNEVPHGTGSAFIPRGTTELTVDIRVVWPLGPDGERFPLDWPLADGHFFRQKVSSFFQWCDGGFAVTNAEEIPFWDTFERLGLEDIGYPISHRYMRGGIVTQDFEKARFQWQPTREFYGVVDTTNYLANPTHKPVFAFGPRLRVMLDEVKVIFDVEDLRPSSSTGSSANAAVNSGDPTVYWPIADDQGRFNSPIFSGTVWVDENADGIRQPEEPPAAQAVLTVSAIYPSARWSISVFYFRSGVKLVRKIGRTSYTHRGLASHRFEPGEEHQTLSIRVIKLDLYDERLCPEIRDLPNGRFFHDQNYQRYNIDVRCDTGFAVTNADGIPFWDTWQRLGLENVGYPISYRYMWRGLVTQAFEKAIMQWQPGKGVQFVNISDELHDAGLGDKVRAGELTIANGGVIAKRVGESCPFHNGYDECTHWFFPLKYKWPFGPFQTTPRHVSTFE